MADYYEINNYSGNGHIRISREAFRSIIRHAVDDVQGASIAPKGKRSPFRVSKPIQVVFRNNGQVQVAIEVALKSGADIMKICTQIQEHVKQDFSLMAETVPFSVSVTIAPPTPAKA